MRINSFSNQPQFGRVIKLNAEVYNPDDYPSAWLEDKNISPVDYAKIYSTYQTYEQNKDIFDFIKNKVSEKTQNNKTSSVALESMYGEKYLLTGDDAARAKKVHAGAAQEREIAEANKKEATEVAMEISYFSKIQVIKSNYERHQRKIDQSEDFCIGEIINKGRKEKTRDDITFKVAANGKIKEADYSREKHGVKKVINRFLF